MGGRLGVFTVAGGRGWGEDSRAVRGLNYQWAFSPARPGMGQKGEKDGSGLEAVSHQVSESGVSLRHESLLQIPISAQSFIKPHPPLPHYP